MAYVFSDLLNAFAQLHWIADDKRQAFIARLQHLQKQKFPQGTNSGRGKAAVYRAEHVMQIAIVLELNQFGLTPEKAIRLTTRSMGEIAEAVMLASDDGDEPRTVVCHVPVSNLEDLADQTVSDWGLICMTLEHSVARLVEIGDRRTIFRAAMFSMSGLLTQIPLLLRPNDDAHAEQFIAGVRDWATPIAKQYGGRIRRDRDTKILLEMMDERNPNAEKFAVAAGLVDLWMQVRAIRDGHDT